jgi:hypothetical protein
VIALGVSVGPDGDLTLMDVVGVRSAALRVRAYHVATKKTAARAVRDKSFTSAGHMVALTSRSGLLLGLGIADCRLVRACLEVG